MPITIFTGKPGTGKTLMLADTTRRLSVRNFRFEKKTKVTRVIASNLKFTSAGEDIIGRHRIHYWSDPRELVYMSECDVIWDEMPTHLDATEWANMSLELKRWLQQHRKIGVEIYGTAQSFSQVDISARRLVTSLFWLNRVIGSRPPSATKPDVKFIWGLGFMRSVEPLTFDESAMKFISFIPSFFFFDKHKAKLFDTSQLINVGEYPPLRHVVRRCEFADDPKHNCNFVKVVHR